MTHPSTRVILVSPGDVLLIDADLSAEQAAALVAQLGAAGVTASVATGISIGSIRPDHPGGPVDLTLFCEAVEIGEELLRCAWRLSPTVFPEGQAAEYRDRLAELRRAGGRADA